MTSVAKDYAAALFMLGAEENRLDGFCADIQLVRDMFRENPEYIDLLASPALDSAEAEQIVCQAFQDSVDADVLSFLHILCQRGHIRQIDECCQEFETLYKTSKNISTAHIVSAVALSADQQTALKAKLEKALGRTVELVCRVDDTLMGGLTVTVDGKLMDGSLKHRLNEVKEVISK